MECAPEWNATVEQSLAAVVDAVRAAGRNAAAQPLWQFLQRGGRLPAGCLPRRALAGPPVYEAPVSGGESLSGIRRATDFEGAPPLHSVSVVGDHAAAVSVLGEGLCSELPREGLFPVRLPWPAAAVCCGADVAWRGGGDSCNVYARQRGGGAVCCWRAGSDDDGARGSSITLDSVQGLPPGDPVVALEAGIGIAVALTASGAAYGWGDGALFQHFGARGGAAVRLEHLSGRRIRRLACGMVLAAAETEEGELLSLGLDVRTHRAMSSTALLQLPADAAVVFPLRDMVVAKRGALLIDAAGSIWAVLRGAAARRDARCELQELPPAAQGQRAVRLGCSIDCYAADMKERTIALTDSGELWEWSIAQRGWQSITAAHPEVPRGLLPQGGLAKRIVLLPDLSCGRSRVHLLARIAARLRLPSDVVRVVLLRYAVQSCYIVGPEDDPFGWPSPAAPAARRATPAAET